MGNGSSSNKTSLILIGTKKVLIMHDILLISKKFNYLELVSYIISCIITCHKPVMLEAQKKNVLLLIANVGLFVTS